MLGWGKPLPTGKTTCKTVTIVICLTQVIKAMSLQRKDKSFPLEAKRSDYQMGQILPSPEIVEWFVLVEWVKGILDGRNGLNQGVEAKHSQLGLENRTHAWEWWHVREEKSIKILQYVYQCWMSKRVKDRITKMEDTYRTTRQLVSEKPAR